MSATHSSGALPQSNFALAPGAVSQWRFPAELPPPVISASETQKPEELSTEQPGDRRGSDDSNATLQEDNENGPEDFSRFSLSSYKHPYDIQPPPEARGLSPQESAYLPRSDGSKNMNAYTPPNNFTPQSQDIENAIHETCEQLPRRRRGYLTNLIDLYNAYDEHEEGDPASERRGAIIDASRRTSRLVDPLAYDDEQILDPDDPMVTGAQKECLEDPEDVEKNARRLMNYKDRRKQQERIRIEFNVTCEHSSLFDREKLIPRISNSCS